MNYISLLGAFQALIVLGIFIVFSTKKSVGNDRILSWLLACIFIHLTGCFVMNKAFPEAEIHKGYITFIQLLYAPLLWLYARTHHKPQKLPAFRMVLLFVPVGLAAIAYFIIAGYVITHGGKTPAYIEIYNKVVGWGILISFIFFGIKSLNISQQLSGLSLSEKQLIRLIAAIFIGIVTMGTILSLFSEMFPGQFSPTEAHLWIRIVTYTTLLIVCLAIGRVKILSIYATRVVDISHNGQLLLADPTLERRQVDFIRPALMECPVSLAEPEISISGHPGVSIENLPVLENKQKKTGLSDALQADIIEKVNAQMVNEKRYTDADLSLDGLAVLLQVPRHHLSESLNKYLGKSFYQYINEYRIQHVITEMDKSRLQHKVPNILSIAFEAGFNSKSSFNQYFKKTTGVTPSAWLKNTNTSGDEVL